MDGTQRERGEKRERERRNSRPASLKVVELLNQNVKRTEIKNR
jgi:hypothetical protein